MENKTEIEKIENEIESLREQLDAIKTKIEKEQNKDKYVMRLEVGDGSLLVIINDIIIGFVGEWSGYIHSLFSQDKVLDAYEKWVETGREVDNSVVDWNGGEYLINVGSRLVRKDIDRGWIYDFVNCRAHGGCADTNIKRHKHNNRPIVV